MSATLMTSRFQSTCPARGTTRETFGYTSSQVIFQSTCPARGTTPTARRQPPIAQPFQSTCPARGTTRIPRPTPGRRPISIHVPREGHDGVSQCCILPDAHFNPRAPRGARLNPPKVLTKFHVFQSTCPARGTTLIDIAAIVVSLFQSTCPARGTT